MEKFIEFAISILIIGGIIGLSIGVDMMIELILLRTLWVIKWKYYLDIWSLMI